MRKLVMVWSCLLLVLAVPSTARAGGSTSATRDCLHTAMRPRSIVLACADANWYVKRLTWRSWGVERATGSGIFHFNDCIPDCADGTFHVRHGRTRSPAGAGVDRHTCGCSRAPRSRTTVPGRVTFTSPQGSSARCPEEPPPELDRGRALDPQDALQPLDHPQMTGGMREVPAEVVEHDPAALVVEVRARKEELLFGDVAEHGLRRGERFRA